MRSDGQLRKISSNRLVLSGSVIVGLLLLVALLAPVLAPNDPYRIDLLRRAESPSADFPLGTDNLGRCLLSRLIHGARISMGASLAVSLIVVTLGSSVGLTSGLAKRKRDGLIMRLVDVVLAFPSLVLALAIAGILGASLGSIVVGVSSVWWAWYARLVRGLVLEARQKDFVLGGIVVGTSGMKLIRLYILPQVLPPVLVLASIETGLILLALSGLSFLGLGVQPPAPEWGAMLNESRLFLQTHPRLMIAPGTAISLAVLGFNLLGEGLRDVFQVKEVSRW